MHDLLALRHDQLLISGHVEQRLCDAAGPGDYDARYDRGSTEPEVERRRLLGEIMAHRAIVLAVLGLPAECDLDGRAEAIAGTRRADQPDPEPVIRISAIVKEELRSA